MGTLESFAEVRRDDVNGEERRCEGLGETEVPSLSVGDDAAGVGPAFSRKRLLTLSEVNFLRGAPAACAAAAAAAEAAALCEAADEAALESREGSVRSCTPVSASTSRSELEAGTADVALES